MKSTVLSILIAAGIIGGAIIFSTGSFKSSEIASTDNISIENGKQIVEITAKGRYSPARTEAKAGMPTVLRVETNGTFDCTSQLTLPNIGVRQILPSTGVTDIDVGAQKAGATVRGVCAMGMYNFEVKFN